MSLMVNSCELNSKLRSSVKIFIFLCKIIFIWKWSHIDFLTNGSCSNINFMYYHTRKVVYFRSGDDVFKAGTFPHHQNFYFLKKYSIKIWRVYKTVNKHLNLVFSYIYSNSIMQWHHRNKANNKQQYNNQNLVLAYFFNCYCIYIWYWFVHI